MNARQTYKKFDQKDSMFMEKMMKSTNMRLIKYYATLARKNREIADTYFNAWMNEVDNLFTTGESK